MGDKLHVLVIEDNLGDFHLLEESFDEQGIPASLYLAENAVQAFSFLSRQGGHAASPVPDLILLDLNLPVIHGAKILDVIRTTKEWSHLPVAVLSSSTLKKDQELAATQGIEAYLVKPAHYDGYLELARLIGDTCRRLAHKYRRRTTLSLNVGAAASRAAPAQGQHA
jgi:CheY-like chemotaxis protein